MDNKYNTIITSWNIQSTNHVLGSKFDDADFFKKFDKSQFVCLQEIRQEVKHPGFKTFNNTRTDNRNGGVCIMVRHEISNGVKHHKTSIPDVIACKLDKKYFQLTNDIFIINSYIKPANTSTKRSDVSGLDILHDLDQLINNLRAKGEVILCGDFNARIGLEF